MKRIVFTAATTVAMALSATGGAVTVASAAVAPAPQTITGIVQTVVAEKNSGRDTTMFKILRSGADITHLAEGSLAGTPDGTQVTVTVAPAAGGDLTVLSTKIVSAAAVAAPTAVPAIHQVYVALVVPKGVAADPTITEATTRAMIAQVSSYWSSQTEGQVSFDTVRVIPTYVSAFGCLDANGLSNTDNFWVEAEKKMPEALGTNKHLVVIVPNAAYWDTGTCTYFGYGSVGQYAGMNNLVYATGLEQTVIAHELGHNLGLLHSASLRCEKNQDGTQVNTYTGTSWTGCDGMPYDDTFDVMGFGGFHLGEGSLNAVHIDEMGLLPYAIRKLPANSGVTSVRLAPLSTTTDYRALKVTDPTGANYYVEYRTNSGRDAAASLMPEQYAPSWGVRVLRDNPMFNYTGASSYELDASPTGNLNSDYNRVIPVGGTLTAASKKLTITVTSQDATGANVIISNGVVLPPGAPTAVGAIAGENSATVSWASPKSGEGITGYTVTAAPGGRTATTSGATFATVTGLTNGTSYTFTVTATNTAGTSAASAASTAVTPRSGKSFTAVSPRRVLDTRIGRGAVKAKVGTARSVTLTIPGLPSGTSAVALNVTVTNPTATSYLTVYPAGQSRPTASNLNFVKAQTIPNMVIAPVGAGNKVTFFNAGGTVDILADLAGYYAPGAGAGYTATAPSRVLDTREGLGVAKAKVGAAREVTLTIPGLPTGTSAVALNVTVTNPTATSYLTVYPAGLARPTASNLNFVKAQTIPNMVIARVGAGNTVTFFNAGGTVDILADLAGYYAAP